MTRILLLGAVATLVLSACNQTTAGIACERRAQCDDGQDCFTAAPGGFCTRGCTEPGQLRDCPEGTICSSFGGDLQLCSKPCQTNADCRVNYECQITHQGGTESACRPLR